MGLRETDKAVFNHLKKVSIYPKAEMGLRAWSDLRKLPRRKWVSIYPKAEMGLRESFQRRFKDKTLVSIYPKAEMGLRAKCGSIKMAKS